MKKLIPILLAVLMISACTAEKEPEILPEENSSVPELFEETNPGENCSLPSDFSSGEEKIPEEEPEFEFEKPEILYPENVPEELFESAAFKKAMERPSVILYDYEPISDCNAAVNFVEAVEKGEYARLYIFRFSNIDYYETKDASCTCFVSENGIITETAEDWQDWETKKDYEYSETVKNVYINDYGFFTVESEIYDPIYYQVISDFALYENAAEYRELKEKYIDPIFTITVSPEDFGSVSELSDKLIWLFEDIYNYENEHDPWQEFGSNWPVSEMLSLLNRYFEGVTREMLLSSRNIDYDPKTDTIFYEGGRGGVPPERRVFDFEQKGDILNLYYHLYHEESGTIYDDRYFVLEIRLLPDGSFRYLSQKTVVQTDYIFEKQAAALAEIFAELMTAKNHEPQPFEPDPERFFIKFAEFALRRPNDRTNDLPYIGFVWESENIYHFSVPEMKRIAFELFGIEKFEPVFDYGNNFEYVPENDEFVSSFEFGTEPIFGCKDISVSCEGNVFISTFTLIDTPFFPGTDEYGEYEIVFELIDESYLRFTELRKADE